MLARLGQHSEFTTNPFVNSTPWSTSSRCTFGICASVFHRWSSVRMSTMLGPCGVGGPQQVRKSVTATNAATSTAATASIGTLRPGTAVFSPARSRNPTGWNDYVGSVTEADPDRSGSALPTLGRDRARGHVDRRRLIHGVEEPDRPARAAEPRRRLRVGGESREAVQHVAAD